MQIIEHSIIGTRSAMLRFKSRRSEIRFVLFPMIHVADPAFYQDVTTRLRDCDLVVVEGVTGRSPLVSALTLTYRVIPANRSSGLVEQDIDYRSLGVPIIAPDASAAEVGADWRRVPLMTRLWVWLLIPYAVVVQLIGGRRALLRPDVEVNDLPSGAEEEWQNSDFGEHFETALVRGRDRRLLEALAEIHRTRSGESIDVGVVYGAGHVPGIVEGLYKLGYRAHDAEWMTVVAA